MLTFRNTQSAALYAILNTKIRIIKNKLHTDDNFLSWSNIAYNGYPNNGICSYNLIIKPKTEVIVHVAHGDMRVEAYADHLRYYPDGNDSIPIDVYLLTHDIVLYPNEDGTNKQILWEFITDGSWQSLGFDLNFIEIGEGIIN